MSTEYIFVTDGFKQYIGAVLTETSGEDVSDTDFQIALGTSRRNPPSTGWQAPDVSTAGPDTASRVLKMLIQSSSVTPGTYWLWARITDTPEILPERLSGRLIIR